MGAVDCCYAGDAPGLLAACDRFVPPGAAAAVA
jgi:hypothetical protein